MFQDLNQLFADGGVIGHNPSTTGGTWAYRILKNGLVVADQSGVITPEMAKMREITNNLTEMCAVVAGLRALPNDWQGTVHSDSQITLGRIFHGWKWNGIPDWLHAKFQEARKRLVNWENIRWVLLDGHPTKAQLKAGIGSRGHPVSEHNVWCDWACGEAARRFLGVCAQTPERGRTEGQSV